MSREESGNAKKTPGPAITDEQLASLVEAESDGGKDKAVGMKPAVSAKAPGGQKAPSRSRNKEKTALQADKAKAKGMTKPQGSARSGKPGGKGAKKPMGVQTLSRIAAAAVAIAVIALGYGLYAHVTSQARYAVLETELTPVVVAAADIEPGVQLEAGNVTVKEMPVNLVPEGAAGAVEQVVGSVTTTEIPANMPITRAAVASDKAARLSGRVDAGHVAVTVAVGQQEGVSGLVHQGDNVTVFGKFASGDQRVIARNVEVLALNSSLDLYDPTYTSVTLDVSENDATTIADAAENGTVYLFVESTAL